MVLGAQASPPADLASLTFEIKRSTKSRQQAGRLRSQHQVQSPELKTQSNSHEATIPTPHHATSRRFSFF